VVRSIQGLSPCLILFQKKNLPIPPPPLIHFLFLAYDTLPILLIYMRLIVVLADGSRDSEVIPGLFHS
jgi:hypothetical protein